MWKSILGRVVAVTMLVFLLAYAVVLVPLFLAWPHLAGDAFNVDKQLSNMIWLLVPVVALGGIFAGVVMFRRKHRLVAVLLFVLSIESAVAPEVAYLVAKAFGGLEGFYANAQVQLPHVSAFVVYEVCDVTIPAICALGLLHISRRSL